MGTLILVLALALSLSALAADNARDSGGNALVSVTGYNPLNASPGPFTVAMWVKNNNLAQTNTWLTFAYDGPLWGIQYGATAGKVTFIATSFSGSDPGTGSAITIPDTGWHHIAYRKIGSGAGEWAYFLDGVKTVINASVSFTLSGTSVSVVYGVFNSVVSTDASVQYSAVWNTDLSDGEMSNLASCALPASIQPGSLAISWYMNGSSPETDQSGNGHNGTVTGTTVVTGNCPTASAPVRHKVVVSN